MGSLTSIFITSSSTSLGLPNQLLCKNLSSSSLPSFASKWFGRIATKVIDQNFSWNIPLHDSPQPAPAAATERDEKIQQISHVILLIISSKSPVIARIISSKFPQIPPNQLHQQLLRGLERFSKSSAAAKEFSINCRQRISPKDRMRDYLKLAPSRFHQSQGAKNISPPIARLAAINHKLFSAGAGSSWPRCTFPF